jgi:hypothetical protein
MFFGLGTPSGLQKRRRAQACRTHSKTLSRSREHWASKHCQQPLQKITISTLNQVPFRPGMNGARLRRGRLLWANGPQESAQGAARNEQALGFGDNAPPRPRPRSAGAQEKWRTVCTVHGRFSRVTRPPAPIQGAPCAQDGRCAQVPRAALAKARPALG